MKQIIDIVARKRANVQYHDPHIAEATTNEGRTFQSAELTAEALAAADCVALTTNHDVFDMEFVQEHAKLIVDMRNMINEASDSVYKL